MQKETKSMFVVFKAKPSEKRAIDDFAKKVGVTPSELMRSSVGFARNQWIAGKIDASPFYGFVEKQVRL